ncbi:MAG TPA: isopentenyl phosphate kinase family protein [Euryarchaeota archaeon]|nr:isopentenyl phosphate kinase family protein [Euryarchaeota archaeon]
MIIVKLGGSLLTSKNNEFSLRRDVLRRVARELKEGIDGSAIIVHGGGSFGHPLAEKYSLHEGFKSRNQIEGFVLTRLAMQSFNSEVVASLVEVGLPAISLATSSIFITENKYINSYSRNIVEGFLRLGTFPVLYGDVVLDRAMGFCILSGDRIISKLTQEFKPDRIILATDVDGIFTASPKLSSNAELIEEINPENYREILSLLTPEKGDVTGGMLGKLEELVSMANLGYESIIVNALSEGRLKKVLLGEKVKGSVIRGGNYY